MAVEISTSNGESTPLDTNLFNVFFHGKYEACPLLSLTLREGISCFGILPHNLNSGSPEPVRLPVTPQPRSLASP